MIENNHYFDSRKKKAEKITRILSDYRKTKLDFKSYLCLDLGSNTGVITTELSSCCDHMIGLDLSYELVKAAKINNEEQKINFLVGDGLNLPFKSELFDLVICAQVYEHTTSPTFLLQEIYRVLRSGGICFFSGPNRLWFYEYHYNWYFLHWLPKKLLNTYFIKVYGRDFDLNLLSYWELRKVCSAFETVDYSLNVAYELSGIMQEEKLRRIFTALIPRSFAKHFPFLIPNFNWILVKR